MKSTVARSSSEVEYRAFATATTDIIWVYHLLWEFHISISEFVPLYCDNPYVIALAHNPAFHALIKHIEINYHFLWDQVKSYEISNHKVSSVDWLADIFTMSLSTPPFSSLCDKLTIQYYFTDSLDMGNDKEWYNKLISYSLYTCS